MRDKTIPLYAREGMPNQRDTITAIPAFGADFYPLNPDDSFIGGSAELLGDGGKAEKLVKRLEETGAIPRILRRWNARKKAAAKCQYGDNRTDAALVTMASNIRDEAERIRVFRESVLGIIPRQTKES